MSDAGNRQLVVIRLGLPEVPVFHVLGEDDPHVGEIVLVAEVSGREFVPIEEDDEAAAKDVRARCTHFERNIIVSEEWMIPEGPDRHLVRVAALESVAVRQV